jgi:hypothetical protein
MDKTNKEYSIKELEDMLNANEKALKKIILYMTCCHIPFSMENFVPMGSDLYNKKVKRLLSEYKKRDRLSGRIKEEIKRMASKQEKE